MKEPGGELAKLLNSLSDETLSDTEAARLNGLLRGDPEACEIYLDHITLEAQLERELGRAPVAETSTLSLRPFPIGSRPSRMRSRSPLFPPLAAAALAMLGLAFWWFAPRSVETSAIATLLFAENCEWKASRAIAEGNRLCPEKLRLSRGTAVIRFDGGAEIVLRGATTLELKSATRAMLEGGEVVVRAEGDAAGFVLETPASTLLDLGTEFAVRVDGGGGTELHVIEGEVAVEKGRVVTAGQAMRMNRTDSEPTPIALRAARFADIVKDANPRERPDLMTVYEGFFHDVGSYRPEEISKGKGWAAPWRLRLPDEQRLPDETDSTGDMRIVHGQLSVPWPVAGGRLGMLEMPAGRSFRLRPMDQPIDMKSDGITYFSLMTQEPDHDPGKPRTKPVEGIRLTFRNSADYWGESLSFGWNINMRPQIQAGDGGAFVSPAAIPDEQSLLWIGKIIRRASGEDEVSFRIYGQEDTLDYAEPATWHVVSRELHQSASLDLVVLSSTGASPRIVDELRIGPSWRSVVPIQTPILPAPRPRSPSQDP